MIETQEDFWERLDTLFFAAIPPRILPKVPNTKTLKFTQPQCSNSQCLTESQLRDRLLDCVIAEDSDGNEEEEISKYPDDSSNKKEIE